MKTRREALADIELNFNALEESQRQKILVAQNKLTDLKAQRIEAIQRVEAYFKAVKDLQTAGEVTANPPEEVKGKFLGERV